MTAAPRSLKKNFSWTAIGNIVYAACQWGILSALAKLGNAEMVGQFALAIAVTTPIMAFANMQLRSIQATDAKSEFCFGDYLALRIATTVVALVLIAGIAGVSSYSGNIVLIILVMAIGRAFDALSDVFYGRFQQHEQMDLVAKAMMANGVLSFIGLYAGVWITGSLVVGVAGSATASAITLAFVVVLLNSRIQDGRELSEEERIFGHFTALVPRWSRSTALQLFTLALPLGLVMFLVSLNGNIPRYIIEHFLDARRLGIYSALAYLLVAGTTVVSALGQSASPRLAILFAAGDLVRFRALLSKLVVIGLILGLLGAMLSLTLGRQILTLLYTDEYGEHVHVLVVLAFSAGVSFAASFLGYGMTAARQFRPQVPLFTVICVISFILCSVLIPRYGITGAAISLIGGAIAQFIGSGYVVARALRLRGV